MAELKIPAYVPFTRLRHASGADEGRPEFHDRIYIFPGYPTVTSVVSVLATFVPFFVGNIRHSAASAKNDSEDYDGEGGQGLMFLNVRAEHRDGAVSEVVFTATAKEDQPIGAMYAKIATTLTKTLTPSSVKNGK